MPPMVLARSAPEVNDQARSRVLGASSRAGDGGWGWPQGVRTDEGLSIELSAAGEEFAMTAAGKAPPPGTLEFRGPPRLAME